MALHAHEELFQGDFQVVTASVHGAVQERKQHISRYLKDRKTRGLSVECRGENGPAREVLKRGRSHEYYITRTLLMQTTIHV